MEERDGISFPLTEVAVRYRAPALYDDLLEVHTRLDHVGGARVRFDYRIVRPADGKLLATGSTTHAATRRDGRATRLPPTIRERLSGIVR
jgi:acyl-CoA thioester hydrolase